MCNQNANKFRKILQSKLLREKRIRYAAENFKHFQMLLMSFRGNFIHLRNIYEREGIMYIYIHVNIIDNN